MELHTRWFHGVQFAHDPNAFHQDVADSQILGVMGKSETRNPKSERRPKVEAKGIDRRDCGKAR
jgi:hypothetical protein